MKRYTIKDKNYECRMLNCRMESYLFNFGIDVDSTDFCEDCPFMFAINRLAKLEDIVEPYESNIQMDHG